jgi:hypothetical protein
MGNADAEIQKVANDQLVLMVVNLKVELGQKHWSYGDAFRHDAHQRLAHHPALIPQHSDQDLIKMKYAGVAQMAPDWPSDDILLASTGSWSSRSCDAG